MTQHDESGAPAAAPRIGRLAELVAALSVALAAAIIVLPPAFASQDASSHLLAAQVHLHPERFSGLYEPRTALTGQSIVTLTAWLAQSMPLIWAAKLVLLAGLSVQVGAAAAIARRARASIAVAVAGAAMAFVGWTYAMGFFSFTLGVALGVHGWALWFGRSRAGKTDVIAACVWLVAAWSHSIAAGIVIANAVLIEVLGGRLRVRTLPRLAAILPAACWSTWASIASLRHHGEIGAVEHTPAVWLDLVDRAWTGLSCGFGAYSPWAALPAAIVLAIAVATALRRDAGAQAQRVFAAGALIWTVVYLAMPFHGLGWHFAGPRVLVAASGLACVGLVGRSRGLISLTFSLVAAVVLASSLGTAMSEGRRIAASIELFGSEPVGRTFVVTHRPESLVPIAPWIRPNLATGRYATFAGGADPGALAYDSPVHSIRFAVPMAELFAPTRLQYLNVSAECIDEPACASLDLVRADEVAAAAISWDSVTLVEPTPAFVERLVARGFVMQAPAVLRPRSSEVTLSLRVGSEAQSLPIVFAASWPETIGRFRGGRIAAGSDRPAELTVSFSPMPAGPTVFVACADADDDGECGANDLTLFGPTVVVVAPAGQQAVGP